MLRRIAWAVAVWLAILLAVAVAESRAISGTTETRQVVTFTGVTPHTPYAAYFYAYHFPGDPSPYALGYSGLPSNASGEYHASVALSDLAAEYEGGEGPVYSVRVCLLEPPLYGEVTCTPYDYVGFVPLSLWTYAG